MTHWHAVLDNPVAAFHAAGAVQEVCYFPASPCIFSRFVETVRKCYNEEGVRTSFSNFSDTAAGDDIDAQALTRLAKIALWTGNSGRKPGSGPVPLRNRKK